MYVRTYDLHRYAQVYHSSKQFILGFTIGKYVVSLHTAQGPCQPRQSPMSQPNLHDDSETKSQHSFLKKEMDVCYHGVGIIGKEGRRSQGRGEVVMW